MHKDLKFSQDNISEKASTGSEEVLTAVRFATKVMIENTSIVSQSQVSILSVFYSYQIILLGNNNLNYLCYISFL